MKIKLSFVPPLDPGFQPAVVFNRKYIATAKRTGRAVPLVIAIERERGLVSRHETWVSSSMDAATFLYVEQIVKFLLWSRGGWRIFVGGPKAVGDYIQQIYSIGGRRNFDCDMMSAAYGKKLQVVVTTAEKTPADSESKIAAGGHLKGCRIGFDLGASDYKVSAVVDGEPVFAEEMPWDPKAQACSNYHYHHISAALHRAAAHLPRVDAIGGSSAGIIVDNEIRVASLLRGIAKKDLPNAVKIFKRIQKEWNVPVTVMNDGDVTALAGALSLRKKGMLGIALGSSQAAGFIDRRGGLPGWLNELAFAPVDYNPSAAVDEWSGDRGVGALYFSQQAVNKLLPAAGIKLSAEMGLPERLKEVQRLMSRGDQRAGKIYGTIGVYLSYALAHYADFYDFKDVLILGRVTTGKGGDIIIETARAVLDAEFPEIAARISLHVPDEKSRRIGQAVAAASLPRLKTK